jgi:hypothetical protein
MIEPRPDARGTEDDGGEPPGASRLAAAAVHACTLAGVGLLLAGAYLAVRHGVPWALPAFGLGFGVLIGLSRSDRLARAEDLSLRRAGRAAETALTLALLAGVLAVGNALLWPRLGPPRDLTRDRAFSLASLTTRQLRSLAQPATFTLFLGRGPWVAAQRPRVLQLLERLRAENPDRVTVAEVSRYADPEGFAALARRVPEAAVATLGGVAVEYGPRHAVARIDELFAVPGGTEGDPAAFVSEFRGEDVLTSILARLKEGTPLRVGLTTGHGEPSPRDLDTPGGLGRLRERLQELGAEIEIVSLVRDGVPEGLDVLLLAGPRTALEPREADRLRAFADVGGRVLLLLDGAAPTGLNEWLKSFNVEVVEAGVVVDPIYNLDGRPGTPYAPIVGPGPHPIVEALANRGVVVPGATALRLPGASGTREAAPNPAVVARPLLRTSPESRLAPAPDAPPTATAPRGPFVVGAAVADLPQAGGRELEGRPRLVVLASPTLATNAVVAAVPTNLDLVTNAIAWLRRKPDLLGIAPATHVARTLVADPGLQARLVLVPTALAAAVLLALAYWAYRARRA